MCALAPTPAAAQASQVDPAADNWRYGLSVYGYLPSLSGSTSAPAGAGGASINVSADKIIDKLKFTFMGSLDAHNGKWGFFTDFIYLDLGGSKDRSRYFTIGDVGLAPSTTADLGLNLKGSIWTSAGEYRVLSDPALTLDLLAGARMLSLQQTLSWSITGDLGPVATVARVGSVKHSETVWDGIVGVKGRLALGESGKWSAPFYVDVGTGESRLTWQVAGGISYAYAWGELSAMWRYLAYDMKSGKTIKDLGFSGPMFGATFRW
ncbi:hypothetical protein AB4Z46_35120 [Variovorax sp. M-6]|uniref:hypothetical protein n=1 Tax=Variovorax sp. M-6 TaxID=3233041 RepID=UPI003F96D33C